MKTVLLILASLILGPLAFAPSASASPCSPLDCKEWLCDQLNNCHVTSPITPYVRNDADGSKTVGIRTCDSDNVCTSDDVLTVGPATVPPIPTIPTLPPVPTVPVAPQNATCFDYNPGALTNGCVTTNGTATYFVPEPQPTVGTLHECVIGTECVDAPVPGATIVWTPLTAPAPGGYFEATVLCGVTGPALCRVDL